MRTVLIAACVVGACTASAPPPPPETPGGPPTPSPAPTAEPVLPTPASSAAPAEEGTLLERLMRSHFVQVAKIRAAVIAGNANGAIAPARTIVEMQGVDTLPKAWRTSVEELQAASARIDESPDLAEVAAATADIGMTCAGCHVVNGGPTASDSAPPESGDSVADRMKRHLWAAEKLWEGLYVPSDDAWTAGADALAAFTFPKETLTPGGVHARHFASQLTSLAKKAQSATDGEARARTYADLLATCSPCHTSVRKK